MTSPAPCTVPLLEVCALSKRHGRQVVLRSVSLTLARGEVLGLLGRSGAGKSTLVRCIAALESCDSGSIRLGDESLPRRRSREQRRRIQMLWQEPMLALSPYRSALQAVIEPLEGFGWLCPPAQRSDRATQALRAVGIDAATAARRPDGLSGGQCQRVLLARALIAGPDVLLLDEPFSALDIVTTAQLLAELPATWARCAVLFVSHDRAVIQRVATRVGTLVDGGLLG